MGSIAIIVLQALNIVMYLIIAKIIISWLIQFQILNINQPIVYQIYSGLQRLFEPLYAPIRRILPNMGAIDIAPMIVIFGIYALQIIITRNFL